MRTYKLTIAYDGTNYQGWQRQANTDRTIQGILEGALTQCTGYEVQADGSGRTDAGVHALGQTVSIVLSGKVQTDLFVRKLNDSLPPDIRILNAELVKNGFHAAKKRDRESLRISDRYRDEAGCVYAQILLSFSEGTGSCKYEKAAGYLTGMHSFAAYTDKKDGKSVRRTVYGITITEEKGKIQGNGQNRIGMGDYVVIRYDGTGFLYHMVRILTGTLLEVGVGERTAESVKEALDSNDRAKAGFLAPARGLFLKEVRYE